MTETKRAYSNWVSKLMIINVCIYILQSTTNVEMIENMIRYFGLTPTYVMQGYLWQFVSYMFLHGSFFHIFFNMMALLVFGVPIEHTWGSKRFLQYYFFTGIGAGLTIFIVNGFIVDMQNIPTIGASGAIFGLLLAFGLVFPNTELLIFFVLPVKAKYLVIIYGVVTLVAVLSPENGGTISHAGHLGGLIFGLIFFAYFGRFGKKWSFRLANTKAAYEQNGRVESFKEKEKDNHAILTILKKLRVSGLESLNDDEFQQLRYFDVMINKEPENICVSEADFDLNDAHCQKCDLFKNCIMRAAGKYIDGRN